MKRIVTLLAVCLFAFSFAAAQVNMPKIHYNQNTDASDETYDDSDDEYEEGDDGSDIFFDYGMHLPGDQYIRLSLGSSYPLNFPDASSVLHGESQLKIGGQGSIGYHSFITSQIALGVDLGFGFNVTIGSHSFNTVPIVITGTYEPSLGKFSFPLTMGIGFAWESYNGKNYFPGLVLKPQVGAHYRISENWSVGLDTAYMFLPQFNSLHHSGEENKYGHFWLVDLCARYMF
ncbi:TP0733 family outer membrane beta-barrel protein [Treponema sp.]|uniref:TP0733 family outer membrane beta-barrel protein n=1 Tax=Treponema sp. TaxID=166 RepID=UPI00388E924C